MNREQRLEMLGRLAEVPSVELKMNIPADQRMALSGLELDAMRGRLREVFFFDTPDLTLYRNGLVTRARRTQGDDDDTVVKLRPAEPATLPPAVRDSPNLKVEMDVTRGAYVVSASLKGVRKAGAVRRAVSGGRPLERLFTQGAAGLLRRPRPRAAVQPLTSSRLASRWPSWGKTPTTSRPPRPTTPCRHPRRRRPRPRRPRPRPPPTPSPSWSA